MGKTEFKNVAFQDFDKLVVESSNLTEITQYGEDAKKHFFPHKAGIRSRFWNRLWKRKTTTKNPLALAKPTDLAPMYRDLAYAVAKQGEVSAKLNYSAAYQWYSLSMRRPAASLSILFNKVTNNFGRSWLWGIVSFLVVSLLLFVLVIATTECKFEYFSQECILGHEAFLELFAKFINPTRRIFANDDIFDKHFGKTIYTPFVILFSYAIMLAWLYQIVQAFRRFGRK